MPGARNVGRMLLRGTTRDDSAMTHRNTTHVGPLGSAIHVLRADARTVEQLAAIDWSRHFRRVCLDPVRGLITLMSPSRLHEDLSEILGELVGGAADALGRASKGLRSTRLRGRSAVLPERRSAFDDDRRVVNEPDVAGWLEGGLAMGYESFVMYADRARTWRTGPRNMHRKWRR